MARTPLILPVANGRREASATTRARRSGDQPAFWARRTALRNLLPYFHGWHDPAPGTAAIPGRLAVSCNASRSHTSSSARWSVVCDDLLFFGFAVAFVFGGQPHDPTAACQSYRRGSGIHALLTMRRRIEFDQ